MKWQSALGVRSTADALDKLGLLFKKIDEYTKAEPLLQELGRRDGFWFVMVNDQEAFKETMADAENRMEARVRMGDQDQDFNRAVANMVYAAFVHRETRPIGGYQIRIIISTLSR